MAKMPRWALILYYSLLATILIGWTIGFAGWVLQAQPRWPFLAAGWIAAIAFASGWLLNNGFHVWNRLYGDR
jgi:hypothetical protein